MSRHETNKRGMIGLWFNCKNLIKSYRHPNNDEDIVLRQDAMLVIKRGHKKPVLTLFLNDK